MTGAVLTVVNALLDKMVKICGVKVLLAVIVVLVFITNAYPSELKKSPEGDKETLSDMVLYDKKIIDSFFNAVKERNINEVNSFLSKGIDPNYVNEYGESALLFAIMTGDAEVVRKLVSAGADPDSKDTHGTPVLTLASDEGYLDIVKVLLDAGADVNKKDNDGSTALMEASEKDHIDIVKILLVAGADPDVENDNGVTALWMASSNGLAEVSELLLPLTKNIDAREKYNKSTPLINMARWGKVSTVKALLDKGADMNAQDTQGWTALMWAAKDNYQDIVNLLLGKGADFKIKNRFGNTALKLARKEGNREIVQMLEKAAAKE